MKQKALIFSTLFILFSIFGYSQSVSFNVKTVTYNGKYAPANCFALWITNSDGVYVKTINRQSDTYTRFLTYWNASSSTKLLDGMTGASNTTHNQLNNGTDLRIPFIWNCTDYNGNPVADGNYYVNVEFTEINGTGKYARYLFAKGASSKDYTFPNSTYFTNVALNFKSATTAVKDTKMGLTSNFVYNKVLKTLQIKNNKPTLTNANIFIYNSNGILLLNHKLTESVTILNLSNYPSGVYIVKTIQNNKMVQTQKVLID